MNAHSMLQDFIRDMVSLHEAMIAIGALISAVCFKFYVPKMARDRELTVNGLLRLSVTAGLVLSFGFLAQITGEGFDGLASYINPQWQKGNTEFDDIYAKIVTSKQTTAKDSNSGANSWNPIANMARDMANNVYAAVIMAFLTILAWLARGVMFLMEIAHCILLNLEYALMPAMMGFIAHPRMAYLGYGFLSSFIGIQMWIPGFALVMKANDSIMRSAFTGLSSGQLAAGSGVLADTSAAVSPLLGSFALFGIFALWTIVSLLAVPKIVGNIVRGAGFAGAFGMAGMPALQKGTQMAAMAVASGGTAAGIFGAGPAASGAAASSGAGASSSTTPPAASTPASAPPAATPNIPQTFAQAGAPSLNAPPPELDPKTGESRTAQQAAAADQKAAKAQPAPGGSRYSDEAVATAKANLLDKLSKPL